MKKGRQLTQALLNDIREQMIKEGASETVRNKKGEPCFSSGFCATPSVWRQIMGGKDYKKAKRLGMFLPAAIPNTATKL